MAIRTSQVFESITIALDAIWSNKLRSLMTVLGNIVAVASIVAVVSLIQGLNETVRGAILTQAGADAFMIERRGVTTSQDERDRTRNNPALTLKDAEAVRRLSPLAATVMARTNRNGTVGYDDRSIDSVNIQGVTAEYINFGVFNVERGRLMSSLEVERAHRVAVLGWQTADRLFGDIDPVGKTVKIQGVHFRVLGVSVRKGAFLGRTQDEFAILPLGSFQTLFGPLTNLQLQVLPRDPSVIEAAMDEARTALRTSRRLKPAQPDNFGMFTSETFLDLYRRATTGIFAVLVGVVALSLVVGGIVIMNIMLMAVTQRTREIGLRKALGARRSDITWQILTESVVLSTFGGGVGTMLGFAIAQTITRLTPVPAAVEVWSVALGLGITALAGAFFGIYPARRAARLEPIEALRRE